MTDLQKWQEFFASYGLAGEIKTHAIAPVDVYLEFEAQKGSVEGYYNFQAVAVFDKETEKFLSFGVWE